MATLVQSASPVHPPLPWFWGFLKEELSPYPSRTATVARMVLASTLVMIIGMTFRLQFTFQGAIYALLISRESPRATLQSGGLALLTTAISAAYLLTGAGLVLSSPIVHFFWNIVSYFLAFYVLATVTNYTVAAVFAIVMSIGVQLWDRFLPAETNLEDTLRLALITLIGVAATAVIELAFARSRPKDAVLLLIAERLDAVRELLTAYAQGTSADRAAAETKVARLDMLGTSLVRRLLNRSVFSLDYRAEMGAVIGLVGRLVDIAAALTHLPFEPSPAEEAELRDVAETIGRVCDGLKSRQIPEAISFPAAGEHSTTIPMLREMENLLTLIPRVFTDPRLIEEDLAHPKRMPLLASDAFVNPAYLRFAAAGCVAASACYVIYNAVAFPGINTAVTTCLLTALSTIGASRQKQFLRLAGALVGAVLGMGSQIFILPHIDSIGGFTVHFIAITAFASWIMTSSPRLSYLGLQTAVTYNFINLQEFAIQPSLEIARNRVIGILLGLLVMGLVFNRLWGGPVAVEMKTAFLSGLRSLARLAREPAGGDLRSAVKRTYSLQESINAQFDQARSLADAVIFQFGPSRRDDLALRNHIRRWQPQLRTLLLMRIVSLRYRLQLPGFELPEAARSALQAYDERSAEILEDMADRFEGKVPPETEVPTNSVTAVEEACREGDEQSHCETFLILLWQIEELTASLAEQIAAAPPMIR